MKSEMIAPDPPHRRRIAAGLLVVYLVWLAVAALSPAPRHAMAGPVGFNLAPFHRIGQTLALGYGWQTVRLLAGNVLVFVPFGILFPLAMAGMGPPRTGSLRSTGWRSTLLAGTLLSAGIELAQLAISLAVGNAYRDPDVDDVLLNVAGVALGLALLRAWRRWGTATSTA
jgi:glycopeptide antibiotics resistance protein